MGRPFCSLLLPPSVLTGEVNEVGNQVAYHLRIVEGTEPCGRKIRIKDKMTKETNTRIDDKVFMDNFFGGEN